MKALSILVIACLLGCAGHSTALAPEKMQKHNAAKLWAAISINEPVFTTGWTKNLQINFTLVNDSDTTLNPEIEASEIIVNGKAWTDSNFLFSNGPRDKRFWALPPKDHLLFGYAFGERFNEPGIYKVAWKGKTFEAPEIVFRVLPQPQK